MDRIIKELKEINAAIEMNLNTMNMVEGFRETSDMYLRALRARLK